MTYDIKKLIKAKIEERINNIKINLDSIEDWRYRLQREHDIELMKEIVSLINSIPESPVKEDLEKAANNFLDTQDIADMFCGSYEGWQVIEAFKAGARWQSEQSQENSSI